MIQRTQLRGTFTESVDSTDKNITLIDVAFAFRKQVFVHFVEAAITLQPPLVAASDQGLWQDSLTIASISPPRGVNNQVLPDITFMEGSINTNQFLFRRSGRKSVSSFSKIDRVIASVFSAGSYNLVLIRRTDTGDGETYNAQLSLFYEEI